MLRQALRRCIDSTTTMRAAYLASTAASTRSSGGAMTTSRQQRHRSLIYGCDDDDGAHHRHHRRLTTTHQRRRGQWWTSVSPLGARGKKTAASSSSSASSASASASFSSSSSSHPGVKRRTGKGKKSEVTPAVASLTPAAPGGGQNKTENAVDCCCDGYAWVLLGCDSDAGGALAVVKGPSVGIIAAVDVLDAPTVKVEVNGKPRTRLCVEQMVGCVWGRGGGQKNERERESVHGRERERET